MTSGPSPARNRAASTEPEMVIAGAGRVGRSLALALGRRGRTVRVLARRPGAPVPDPERGTALAVEPLGNWHPAAGPARLILAVPDDALPSLAEDLAGRFPVPPPADWTVFHCSGALASAVLEPFRARGLPACSWHPLQSFARPDPHLWSGIPVVMEGDPMAIAAGRELAGWLEAEPVEIPADARPLYHCLATISCAHEAALLLFCHRALAALPPEARQPLWEGFRRLAADARIPVFALGGLQHADCEQALSRGAHGIAMVRGAWLPASSA